MKERMKGKGADIFFENTSAQSDEHTVELDSMIDLNDESKLPIILDREKESTQTNKKTTNKSTTEHTNKDTDKDTNKDIDKDAVKSTNKDTDKDTTHVTNKGTVKDTDKDTTHVTNKYTTNVTDKYTTNVTDEKKGDKYIIQIEKTSEPYNKRLVANVTTTQKQYIKTTAKKNKLKESELVRFMIDFFIENFEFK